MSLIFRSFGILILGTLGLALCSSTQASYSTMTTTVTIPQTTTDFTQSLAVQSFDSKLGTLVNVVLSYTDSSVMHGFVQNTSMGAQNFKVTEDSTINLAYGTTNLLTNDLISQQSYTQLGPTQSAQYGINTPTGSAGPTTISSGPLFQAFLQPSSKVMLSFSTLTTTTVIGGGGNIATGIYTTAGATVTVEYIYQPLTVPEPASLAMTTIGGLAVIGASYRNRRNRRRFAAGK